MPVALAMPTMPTPVSRPSALTRPERLLVAGNFGAGVIAGMSQATRADRVAISNARTLQGKYRAQVVRYTRNGSPVYYSAKPVPVLTSGASQFKLGKNATVSLGLMLTPERGIMRADLADARQVFRLYGPVNLCALASDGCREGCLTYSGQSGMPDQQRAQAIRTMFLLAEPYACGLIIGAEIAAALRSAPGGRINLRLNVTSDIRWELVAPELISALSDAGVQLYDYTAWRPVDRRPSPEYHLTYSAKESTHTSDDYLMSVLDSGANVAMPFDTPRGKALPVSWRGYRVIDGDVSDERRSDPTGPVGVIIGLRAKGYRWKRDNSAGFIRAAAGVVQ